MIGAIAGDMIGAPYEGRPIKTKDFDLRVSRFTDDTVLTVAVAHAILGGVGYGESIRSFAQTYPHAGYGSSFRRWMWLPDPEPYHSFGNGAAMRVSPVGFAFESVQAVLEEAERSAEVSHNHPEGIKGAQATALAVYLARQGEGREAIRKEITDRFGYNLDRPLNQIRPGYGFDVSCQGSVPEAIIAFLESDSYEDAIKNAVSLGGDADTMACIAGGIAQAYYRGVPEGIVREVREKLPPDLLDVVARFNRRFGLLQH